MPACALLVLGLAAVAAAAAPVSLYVSPQGNDAWSGRRATPRRDRQDGPLATLAGARDALRRLRAAGPLPGPVQVLIRPGTYRLATPLVLEPQDSGTADCPITWRGTGRGVVISGGRVLTGWRREGKLWALELPEVREGKWHFGSLWVSGERRPRARTPNAGYFYSAGKAAPGRDAAGQEASRERTAFRFHPGDLQPWPDLDQAQVVVYHGWEISILPIAGLEGDTVLFGGPAAWPFEYWGPRQRYQVENVMAALDQPGEWCLHRRTGMLYYLPRPGETPERTQVVAPVAQQLVVLAGEPAQGRFVEHVHFERLALRHTDWPIGPQGYSDGQAASSVGAAWEARGARHCSVSRCEIAHLANYALWLRAGSQDNRIFQCELHDLGAGGVRLGEAGNPSSDQEAALRNVVDNNFIHDGGKLFRGAVGVWIGRSSYNTVSHNEICDLDYTGISVGWSWGYAPSSAHHNVLEYNHIHHLGREVLSDLGGIYSLGISPGTVERYNLIHDVYCYQYGGWGIYTDEGSSDILIEKNVVYNTSTGGFHQHYGKANLVRNNIFAFARDGQLQRSRPEEHISFFFERNIVVSEGSPLLYVNWGNGWFRNDRNLYWDYAEPEPDFFGMTFADWQALGRDRRSLVADPLFVDPRRRDFRLRPGSPAAKIGFRPIATEGIGLYGEPSWVAAPRRIKRGPQPSLRAASQEVSEDFEDTPVGEQARGAATYEQGEGTIRVTEAAAASGRRSLQFSDAAGLDHPYQPHLVYRRRFSSGRLEVSFCLRLEPGAVMYHEWRDGHDPYRVGPRLAVDEQSTLSVSGGKEIGKLPTGQWLRFRLLAPLGKAAGTWELSYAPLSGGRAKWFRALPCSPGFALVRELLWVADGERPAILYLDDVKVKARGRKS